MKKELQIEIPETPNFLRVKGMSAGMLPIRDFTVEELEKIGKEWTQNLIKKKITKS